MTEEWRTESADVETDPEVIKRLERWQDARFGLMMHWGTYSQWGIVESWSLCSEDEPWCQRSMANYDEYKRAYEQLQTTFNPVDFAPAQWADLAAKAGMRYMVFTTKHHDGFCMYDSKFTNYKITDSTCPFHTCPDADVTAALFREFRKRGFMLGAYFSKPDWHNPNYWNPYWATPDRHVNYSIEKHPDLWNNFKAYKRGQIEELMANYGELDVLWFDGVWVRGGKTSERTLANEGPDQDIDMDAIVAMARSYQPGLIVVDRWVGGRNENYLTPEKTIPDEPLLQPWETCMTMGDSWSYAPDDHYKSAGELVGMLVDVVAKGGNFLLNVGPDGRGRLPEEVVARLKQIGDWMQVNGEAIYGSRPVAPYSRDGIRFTQGKNGEQYAFIPVEHIDENGICRLPAFTDTVAREGRILGTNHEISMVLSEREIVVDFSEARWIDKAPDYFWVLRVG